MRDFAAGGFSVLGCSSRIFSAGELGVGFVLCGLVVCDVNHEFCSGLRKDEFDSLVALSMETGFVGNAHFVDSAAVMGVQKGFNLAPVAVEAMRP